MRTRTNPETSPGDTERPPPPEPEGIDSGRPTDLSELAPVATEVAYPGPEDSQVVAAAEQQEGEIEEARALPLDHLRGLLEALVFASDKPLTANELARLSSAPVKQVKQLLGEIQQSFAGHGVLLDEIAGGWLFRTNVQFAPFVRELTSGRPVKLTRAQIETLAIVAYRQPVTRPEIDEIRGVDSGATLKLLLERDLLRLLGKKDEPGRPLLYGTTNYFLEFFGLRTLKDLPTLREFTELSEESRRVADSASEKASDEPEQPAAPARRDDTLPESPVE
jgi:segregation and condensation protein B